MELSLPKEDVTIVLLENIADTAVERLRGAGYTSITTLSHSPEPAELEALLAEARFVGIRSRTKLDAALLAKAPKLIGIGCFCIGTNQVDLEAARSLGIPVFNAPFSNTRSVAELTISAIISLMRDLPGKNAQMHRGQWHKSAEDSYEVRGKTLGIVGYGNIGSQVSVLADALGMRVLFYDTATKLAHGNARCVAHIEELYTQADIITYHVPETPQTKGMVDERALSNMKSGVRIINYARGSIIDIDALTHALDSGHVAGAALDVFPEEPEQNGETFISPLCGYDSVLLTPHVAGSTQEAQSNIGLEVAEKIITYSDNGSTTGAVNFPAVALPPHENAHRLLNIHQNVPGMMSAINQVLSAGGVNITGQFLQTQANIGYVVIDIEKSTSAEEVRRYRDEIQALSGSIRTRILH